MSHLVIGLDEAGYGPTLGPLIIGATVFSLPQPKLDLWKSLSSVLTPRPNKITDKLIVCDSKRVYQPERGIGLMETTVLSFLRTEGLKSWPIRAEQLIRYLDSSARLNRYYANPDLRVPLSAIPAKIVRCSAALAGEMGRKSIKLEQVICRIIEVDEFNRFIKGRGNKADLLFSTVAQLVDYIYKKFYGDSIESLEFHIGKQGGRTYYGNLLRALFRECKVQVIKETPIVSSYRIRGPHGLKIQLRFIKDGEDAHFTIALASMYAKYLREVYMRMFNGFYQQYLPGLKPTAGYPQDARRFLREITPVITRLNLNPDMFIRAR